MLEIKNLCKTYYPKNGQPVKALKSVSAKFNEKGLVFILGKSGCGKSTLLNCIGGLDKFDSGEIVIKGKSSKEFTGSDFDSYRNTFIGFIFQEYNILSEFNIEKNIALALELQGKKADKKAVDDILEMVDLKQFGKRKTTELSGGQKQRVAIARALIKDPEIIVADEPTGALDSATGIQVFDTLKKLAQEKLVIVVSHDREFAEIYGDRIIEMKDGVIISDETKRKVAPNAVSDDLTFIGEDLIHIKKGHKFSQDEKDMIIKFLESRDTETIISVDDKKNQQFKKVAKIDDNNHTEKFTDTTDEDRKTKQYNKNDLKLIKSRLKWKDSFKMGASSLKTKPVRLVFTILLSFIAFTIFGVVDTLSSFNRPSAVWATVEKFDNKYVSILKEVPADYGNNVMPFQSADVQILNEKFPDINIKKVVNANIYHGNNFYPNWQNNRIYINNLDYETSNVLKAPFTSGMTNVSREELDKLGFEIVAGDLPSADGEIAISKHIYDCYKELNTEKITSETQFLTTYNSCNINSNSGGSSNYTIVGIIDDHYDLSKYNDVTTEQLNKDYSLEEKIARELVFGFTNMVYVNEQDYAEALNKRVAFNGISLFKGDSRVGYLGSEFTTLQEDWEQSGWVKDQYVNGRLQVEYLKSSVGSLLTPSGDFVDLGKNNVLLQPYQLDELGSGQELYQMIEEGLTVDVKFGYNEDDPTVFTLNVVGIVNGANGAIVSADTMEEVITPNFTGFDYSIAILSDNAVQNQQFVEYCETFSDKNVKYTVQNGATAILDQFGEIINTVASVVFWVGVGFAVFAALLLMNFISTSISYKKREIGILRALGARSSDVFGIFFNESAVIALINFVLATIATFATSAIISNSIISKLGLELVLLSTGIRQVLLIFGVSVLTAFISSILPVYKIAKKQPIDAMNNR